MQSINQKLKKIFQVEKPTVTIINESRSKKKSTTTIAGLEKFNVKLPDAAKLFRQKFACGAAVVQSLIGEEVQIQGDVVDDLVKLLQEKFQVRLLNF